MSSADQLKHFRDLLPSRIVAHIESSEEGLWASLSVFDGVSLHCYTQGANLTELVTMINDAILTRFDVPMELRQQVGYYTPLSQEHRRYEAMFNRLVAVEKEVSLKGESETTFELNTPELQVC